MGPSTSGRLLTRTDALSSETAIWTNLYWCSTGAGSSFELGHDALCSMKASVDITNGYVNIYEPLPRVLDVVSAKENFPQFYQACEILPAPALASTPACEGRERQLASERPRWLQGVEI